MNEALKMSLIAAADGPFFRDDLMRTLVGHTKTELRKIHHDWSDPPSANDLRVGRAVAAMLLMYPHKQKDQLKDYVGVTAKELAGIIDYPGKGPFDPGEWLI